MAFPESVKSVESVESVKSAESAESAESVFYYQPIAKPSTFVANKTPQTMPIKKRTSTAAKPRKATKPKKKATTTPHRRTLQGVVSGNTTNLKEVPKDTIFYIVPLAITRSSLTAAIYYLLPGAKELKVLWPDTNNFTEAQLKGWHISKSGPKYCFKSSVIGMDRRFDIAEKLCVALGNIPSVENMNILKVMFLGGTQPSQIH